MSKPVLHTVVLLSLVLGLVAASPAQTASAQSAPRDSQAGSEKTSPEGLLNSDGTLRLDGNFSGSLDLSGWNVQLDAARGPLFSPPESPLAQASYGHWADLGSGAAELNDKVEAIAVSGNDLYVGGYFVNAGGIPEADYIAKYDTVNSTWSALSNAGTGSAALQDAVLDIAINGANVYVGGLFCGVDDNGSPIIEACFLAKYDSNTSIWSALGNGGPGQSSLNSMVQAISVSGTDVYVGGNFFNVKNGLTTLNEADYIAKWDENTSSWSALGSNGAGNGALSSSVQDIAVNGSNVYVGGAFSNAGGIAEADYVAKWDESSDTWSALGGNGAGNGSLNSTVYALAVNGTDVYVGGNFTNVRNGLTQLDAADYIAKYADAGSPGWSVLGSGFGGGGALNSTVLALAVDGSVVYAGGFFNSVFISGSWTGAAGYLAKFDTGASAWSAVGSSGSARPPLNAGLGIWAIALDDTNLYAGGNLESVTNNGTFISNARYIARFDGADWSALGGVQGALEHEVYAITVSGSDVYVGGSFTNAGGIPEADYIARWDGQNWHALGYNGNGGGAINTSAFSAVYAIGVSGGIVYVGGVFSWVQNVDGSFLNDAAYLAKWDGVNWSPLGNNGAGGGPINGTVDAITVSGTDVYVGGYFTDGGGIPEADYVAKWDENSDTWIALGSNGATDGSLNSYVHALAVSGTNLYVGGEFTNVNNNSATIDEADYVAMWNESTGWSALGGTPDPNGSLNGQVLALAVNGSDVYVGGWFTDINDNGTVLSAADYIAIWDGTNWSALGSNGVGNGALNDLVESIALSGTDVYVGGWFFNVNNGTTLNEADYIAKWDGSDWSALGSDGAGDGALEGAVYALRASSTDLYAGGNFINVSDNGTVLPYADYVAAYGILDPTTTTIITSDSPDPSVPGQAVSVSVTVSGSSGVPTGIVGITGADTNCTITLSGGSGSCNAAFTSTGGKTLTATYNGDGTFAGSLDTESHTVTSSATTTVITSDGPDPSVPGQAVSVNVTVSSASGVPTGTVDITGAGANCTITLSGGSGGCNVIFTSAGNKTLTATYNGDATFAVSADTEAHTVTTSATFSDVPNSYWAWSWIERLYSAGITGGCATNPLQYCPDAEVTRAQMAVFLERGITGASFTPPNIAPTFTDTVGHWAEDWIEALKSDGITGGCGPGSYCPEASTTRAEMAVFLLRAEHGAAYSPPPASGDFSDVPVSYWAASWIEQLAAEGITSGCGAGIYCPDSPVTRAQMAVFLVRTFNLP